MSERNKKRIPQGKYVGHWIHFPNQAKNAFAFVIDEAEDVGLIGKGISQRICTGKCKDE